VNGRYTSDDPSSGPRTGGRGRPRVRAVAGKRRATVTAETEYPAAGSAQEPERAALRPQRVTAPRRPPIPRAPEPLEPYVEDEYPPGDEEVDAPDAHLDDVDGGASDQPTMPECPEDLQAQPSDARANSRTPTLRDATDLPPTMSIGEAGAWLSIGRTTAFRLAQEGTFPVRTIRVGNQRRVVTTELLNLLGIPLAR
jgi:hypothetical protein